MLIPQKRGMEPESKWSVPQRHRAHRVRNTLMPKSYLGVLGASAVGSSRVLSKSVWRSAGEFDQAAAGGPGNDRLVGNDFGFPVFHSAGERDPCADFMAAGAGFGVDFFVRVLGQASAVAGQDFQELLVERNVDLAVLGF